uniref:Mitochondrial ribosomal protein L55 n=1 Tax=Plectus sambesii TaxID=2011161 RepID=A0A914VX19_9BILA
MILSWTRARLLSSVGQVCSSSGLQLPQNREELLSPGCEQASLRLQQLRGNCNRAALGSIRRGQYLRVYPVRLVRPDGSTITVRMKEPRRLAYLPVDLTTLSEQELRERLAARKPQMLINKTDDNLDDNFDVDEYSFMWSEAGGQQKQQETSKQPSKQQPSKQPAKAADASKPKETAAKPVPPKSKDAAKTAKAKLKETAGGTAAASKDSAKPKEAAKGGDDKVAKKMTG